MPRIFEFIRANLLAICTLAGVLGGTALGCILRNTTDDWTPRHVMYLQFPGDIFLRMLKALIIPLLVSSVISAVGSLDLSLSKRIAARAIIFYATTTVCAVILGIILVCVIEPGTIAKKKTEAIEINRNDVGRTVLTQDTLLDLIRNLFPPNLIQAAIAQSQTQLIDPHNSSIPIEEWKFVEVYASTTNVLGLVVFGVVMGISLGVMGEKGKPLLQFFELLSEAMMIITSWVIWISPLGVFFLVTAKIMETHDFLHLMNKLGLYFLTVMLGLMIHGFGTLSVIYFICTRTLPFRTIAKLSQVLITAFGTASSSATMPITIQTLDNMGVDPRVTRFVIPVGATINMDGTALYEAVAALFIAQYRGIGLTFGNIVAVSVTATAASIGAAGIPQAGLVTMVMVLDTVGLPAEDVSLILAVDWLLDRFRTTINVMCDSLGARLVDMLSAGELGRVAAIDKTNAEPHELVEITKDTRI